MRVIFAEASKDWQVVHDADDGESIVSELVLPVGAEFGQMDYAAEGSFSIEIAFGEVFDYDDFVVAPIPRARVSTTVMAKPGFLRSWRSA